MIFEGMELKFRVFDRIHKKTWIVGGRRHDTFHIWEDNQVSYYNYQTGEPSILPGWEIPDDGSGYILMRYTGKHDMAGIEVYEGDIIENPDGIRMEIRYGLYDAYCPADRCNMDSIGFYAVGTGLPEMPIGCLEDYAVVVGNVWENPELLGVQNCEECKKFDKEELQCKELGYFVGSNSGEPCWDWYRERHEDCPFNPQN